MMSSKKTCARNVLPCYNFIVQREEILLQEYLLKYLTMTRIKIFFLCWYESMYNYQ